MTGNSYTPFLEWMLVLAMALSRYEIPTIFFYKRDEFSDFHGLSASRRIAQSEMQREHRMLMPDNQWLGQLVKTKSAITSTFVGLKGFAQKQHRGRS